MASRILAQILIAGGATLFRAAAQAWQQAIINAQKTGVAQEGAKAVARGAMSVAEARKILGVENHASWGEVMKKYDHLFNVNEKHGSFYLQSKVFRAKEALEEEYKVAGQITDNKQQQQQEQQPPQQQ